MATQADFWGEIAPAQVRTPVSILREQAALLGRKTNNTLEAKVSTTVSEASLFVHNFDLVVPALDGYTYRLFRLYHGADIYPVRTDDTPQKRLENEYEFSEWLRERLSSPETKRIIANLLAQVNS